jgi:uncharacterized membrane protein
MMAGTIVGFLAAIFIGFIFFLPHHSRPAPGDGIILLLLEMILVPAGAILGCVGTVRISRRSKIQI